jgi:putative transposase
MARGLWKALRRAGDQVGRGCVERLMRSNAIQGVNGAAAWRTTVPDTTAPRRPDLVGRDFSPTAPNRLWCADFSYRRCWQAVVF